MNVPDLLLAGLVTLRFHYLLGGPDAAQLEVGASPLGRPKCHRLQDRKA